MTDRIADPIECMVAAALDAAGVTYIQGRANGDPDFILPDLGLEIECKQFYSERAVRQLAGKENIILVQGRTAAAGLLTMMKICRDMAHD